MELHDIRWIINLLSSSFFLLDSEKKKVVWINEINTYSFNGIITINSYKNRNYNIIAINDEGKKKRYQL